LKRVPLEELVEINPRERLTKGKEYPFVDMEAVQPGRRYVYPNRRRTYKGGGARFRAGDVLFARITPCLENGKIAQFGGPDGQVAFGSTEFFVFRARPHVADPGFVYYLAMTDFVRKPAEKSMFGASGRQRADLQIVRTARAPAPPLPVQRRIASILGAYDDLIENNLRRIRILEEMARNLYREWFVHFRFPGHEKVPLVDSPIGKIPKGWEATTLGDLAECVRRSIHPEQLDPATPYVGLEHLPRRSLALTEWSTVSTVNSVKLLFSENDILFGKIRPYFHKVVLAPMHGACSSDTLVIRPKRPEDLALVLMCVSSDEFVAYATQTSQGTKMPRANWNVLVRYPVPVPPKRVQDEFTRYIAAMMKQIKCLVARSRNLRRTRDLLLPRLIAGQAEPC